MRLWPEPSTKIDIDIGIDKKTKREQSAFFVSLGKFVVLEHIDWH